MLQVRESSTHAQARGEGQRGRAHGIPAWEWVAAALGLLLLVAALWVLLASGPAGGARPAAVVVRTEPAVQVSGGWLVRYEAENRGDETIADVQLRATSSNGGQLVETVESSLEFLPARSTRRGGVYFTRDPRGGVVEIRAVGYQEP